MHKTPLIAAAALGVATLFAACQPTTPTTAAGACLVGTTDCNDTPGTPMDSQEGAARSLLGVARADLADDVRIARVDDTWFSMTSDYVYDRTTVELDTDEDGVARVTLVTVEYEDGPVTVRAGG